MVSVVVIATSCPYRFSLIFALQKTGGRRGLKTKLARTRGENLIHAVPPDLSRALEGISSRSEHLVSPLTELPVQLTCRQLIAESFLSHARGWFSEVTSLNRFSIRDLFSLLGVDNLLVPVDAFDNVQLLYAAR